MKTFTCSIIVVVIFSLASCQSYIDPQKKRDISYEKLDIFYSKAQSELSNKFPSYFSNNDEKLLFTSKLKGDEINILRIGIILETKGGIEKIRTLEIRMSEDLEVLSFSEKIHSSVIFGHPNKKVSLLSSPSSQ